MPTFQDLYNNPLGTAGQYPLVISGSINSVRQKAAHGATLELMQVYAGRAVYAAATTEGNVLKVKASGNAGTATPQVYFLPWARGAIYRIRPKQANTAGVASNLFFTPNLDGCMITVEGTPDAPTIYHSNAATIQFTPEEQQSMTGVSEMATYTTEQHLKIAKMAQNAQLFQGVAARNPRVPTTPAKPSKDFDILEYSPTLPQQVMNVADWGLQLLSQDFLYGAVFGVRKNGVWTFYKQSFRIQRQEWDEVQKKGWNPFSSETQLVRQKTVTYAVTSAEKYWP